MCKTFTCTLSCRFFFLLFTQIVIILPQNCWRANRSAQKHSPKANNTSMQAPTCIIAKKITIAKKLRHCSAASSPSIYTSPRYSKKATAINQVPPLLCLSSPPNLYLPLDDDDVFAKKYIRKKMRGRDCFEAIIIARSDWRAGGDS